VKESVIRIPRRAFAAAAVVIAIVILLVALGVTGVLARVFDPTAVAPASVIASQQAAAERDVERAYEQAVTQVNKVRALKLAISAQQADAIATKALDDLKALRHSGFVAMGQLVGLTGSAAESYATATEQRFDQAPLAGRPAPTPVLLAPRLYAIVSRMSEVSVQISDKATTDLTAPAPPASTASPTPSATGTRAPSPSPTPSPSR
jgi:hypothetical protein